MRWHTSHPWHVQQFSLHWELFLLQQSLIAVSFRRSEMTTNSGSGARTQSSFMRVPYNGQPGTPVTGSSSGAESTILITCERGVTLNSLLSHSKGTLTDAWSHHHWRSGLHVAAHALFMMLLMHVIHCTSVAWQHGVN